MNTRAKLIKKSNDTYNFKHLNRNDLRIIHDALGKFKKHNTNRFHQIDIARAIRKLIAEKTIE